MENIYYLCPDMNKPSGGVRRLYQHVEILQEEGFPAYILHFHDGFYLQWFTSNVPIRYMDTNTEWNEGDCIVIPEGYPSVMKKLKDMPFRKIVIALSHSYIFPTLPFGETWANYGIEAVLTPSSVVENFVAYTMGIEKIYRFKTSIDHSLFNTSQAEKKLQIAYLPRKDDVVEIVKKILALRINEPVEFLAIENRPIDEYAKLLQESAVFLATSSHEGIHRSIIEAMACGCLCIGYDGIGAREYIIQNGPQQNFIQVENMNYIELVKVLEDTLNSMQKDHVQINNIQSNGVKTASQFSINDERKSIVDFWNDFQKDLL